MTWSVTDARSNTVQQTFKITIVPKPISVTVTALSTSVEEGTAARFTVTLSPRPRDTTSCEPVGKRSGRVVHRHG